jgi:Asp-tRNA(Asn)/Glu-tRNA(Gln) amidotransferase B subunit
LTLRSKELMTVSRLRMVKENDQNGKAVGRLNLTDKDMAKISQWIEDDGISQDIYQQRLDTLLELGGQSDKEALASSGLTAAGQELMNIWNQMDQGSIRSDQGFEAADKAVRQKRTAVDEST